jgi:hypothetical protein
MVQKNRNENFRKNIEQNYFRKSICHHGDRESDDGVV